MPQVTLADIQAAADKKYGDYVIELEDGKVALPSLLRLPPAKRAEFMAVAEEIKGTSEALKADPGADVAAPLERALRAATRTKRDGDRLIKACGGDPAVLMEIFGSYARATQPGEVPASPS